MGTPPQPPFDLIRFELKTLSWTLVLSGAISILIGLLAFLAPLPTIAAVVLLFGAYAIVDGMVNLVAGCCVKSAPVAKPERGTVAR
jgi:uncharacterized membrane protein HdeD (DUF308 family)